MHKLKEYIGYKLVSIFLVTTFILFDLSLAYPAEQLSQNYNLAVPSVFQANSQSILDNGIEIRNVMYEKPGVHVNGEAFIIDLDKVQIEQSVEPEVVNRDFIDKPISENDAKGLGRTLRELVESTPRDRELLLAFNSIHGDYWESGSAVIINGRLVTKPLQARGIFQSEHTPLNGRYWILSLDSGNRGVFEIEIKNGKLPEDFTIKNGLFGPPLILGGKSVVDKLQFGVKPNLEGDQINWARGQRMAFSAIGYDSQGRLVRVAIKGNPDDGKNKELSIDELPEILEKLGVVNALLMGTSADVQTYNSFSDNKFTCANPRQGSYTGSVWPDRGRPLGCHIRVYANPPSDSIAKSQVERFRLFVTSKNLLSPILDIAKYLLGAPSQNILPLPLEYMESVIRHDFQGLPLIVNPSKVDYNNGVVRIRCSSESGDFTVQVANKNSNEAKGLDGYEWDVREEFTVKVCTGHVSLSLSHPSEEDSSIATVIAAAKTMKDEDGYLRLHVFDKNVFVESSDDFVILPLTIGRRVGDFIAQNKIISMAVLPSYLSTNPANSERWVRKLLVALKGDDTESFVQILSDSNSGFSAEVFDRSASEKLPGHVRTVLWKDEVTRDLSNESEVTVSVHQPGYHKDIRFFQNKLRQSDIHVFADNLQFVKQQWHNRQRFGGENAWLTVPLESGSQKDFIRDRVIAKLKDKRWREKHWKRLRDLYSGEPYFSDFESFFRELYRHDWEKLASLNEAIIRFVAKKMGIRVSFIRGSYVNDSGLTKAGYIADLVERVTDDVRIKDGKSATYLSGKGAGWLEDSIEETAENEKKEKDKILDKGIKLRFDSFELEGVSPEDKIDPNMPALEFLAKYGKGGVQDLDRRRQIGLARKNLSTLVNFLSQSNEKSEEARWIVLPVGNDTKVVEKCVSIYKKSQEVGAKILLVENWPRADVSKRNADVEIQESLSLRQALEARGVGQNDIIALHDPSRIKDATYSSGRIMLVQSPLKLRRSAAILKDILKDVKFGAVPAYTLDIENIFENEGIFRNIAEECIKELRWMQDRLPVDNNRRPTHFLPDDVHEAYGVIFRLIRKSTEELFREMRNYSSREEMLKNHGFSNVGMFPVGDGSYRIDNRGMSGIWKCIISGKTRFENRYVLRVADAASKAMNDSVSNNETVCLRFVDDLNFVKGDASISQDRSTAILFSDHTIAVTPEFALKTRDEQEVILRNLIGKRTRELPEKGSAQNRGVTSKERVKPDILVTQIAMVTELRSKDYQHYKCSQKTEGIARTLREIGYDSTYLPIEEDISRRNFLGHYARHKEDIVVISIYQIHRRDLEILHAMYAEIKKINPNAFIVIEGASTDMAKQFLAICPEVDMFVRVESDEIIPKLAAIKEKDKPLTPAEIAVLADNVTGGVFIRSDSHVIISRLNTSNITHNIRLLPPTRYMFDIWYSERGCPRECIFCRRDQGGVQRYVPAEKRVEWMLDRLLLEMDPSSPISRDELKKVLREQTNDRKTLADDSHIVLANDTFIGHEKVRILVVSENALIMRQNIIDFARQTAELGLNKYFIFKIADTDIGTVLSRDEPNTELIEALRSLGVDFLGFGTENPSNTFLKWWHKNQSTERPTGYTTDHILKVNRTLIEAGFSPTSIRHNLILSFPEAGDVDIKNMALLAFASPQYNSMPFYFGNGWGNNRFDRTFDVAASFLSSIDNAQYAWTFSLEPEEQVGSVDLAEYFYVAKGTPEYMVRREFRFLRYIDERIPTWIAHYAHPNFTSFYRYAQKRFLSQYFRDDDIKTAIAAWQDPSETEEVRALGSILEYYCKQFPQKRALEALFLLKAHMVSLEMLSFIEYKKKLDANKTLPLDLESCGVGKLFTRGDELMEPGSFKPEDAIDNFRKAVLTARVVTQIAPRVTKEKMMAVTAICQDGEHTPEDRLARVRTVITDETVLGIIADELLIDSNRQQDINREGYLKRIAYPDSQAFENLRHLYVNEEDEYLFDMIVHRMNEKKIEFPEAVMELCCERMGMSKREYYLYIKAAKEYMKHRVYYCEGGLISQLRSRDPLRRSGAIEAILKEIEKENDPLIIKNVALLFKDLAKGEGLLQVGAYITSSNVVAKLRKAIDMPESHSVFCPGPRLALFGYNLHNGQRLRLFKEEIEKDASGARLNIGQEKIFADNDWATFRIEGNKILLKGTYQYEEAILKAYSKKMRFGDNTELFSKYIGRLAQVLDKHRLQIICEVKEFCDGVGDRPYLRAMFLDEEEFLYVLPIVKMTHDHPDMIPLFMARGIEHFYNAWWMMMRGLEENDKIDNALFVKVGKRLHTGETESTLVAKAINTFLEGKEAMQTISADIWLKVEDTARSLGITDALNKHLETEWGIKGGIKEMSKRHVSRREAVRVLAGFGIDERFISYFRMARGTYFPDLMRKEKFYSQAGGFSVDEFKRDVEAHNASLKYPLPAEALKQLENGLDIIGGSQHLLLPMQRNTINNYLMMFGDTPVGSSLRGTIMHDARPLLNIILADTNFTHMLHSKSSEKPVVLFVDEATSSATSLYLCELVAKAFNPNISYSTANVCQRTADTQRVLQQYGVVDYVAKNGLWPLEDINEMFHGIYLDMRGRGRIQLTYKELIARLWAKQSRVTPHVDRANCITAIEQMNRYLDEFIEQYFALFKFVDSVPSIRHDPQVIKRAMVKYMIERPDAFRKSLIHDNYYTCAGVSEMDYIGGYILRDGLADIIRHFGDAPPIKGELKDLYGKFKCADQALELERHMEKQQRIVQDFIMISDTFIHGSLADLFKKYLAETIAFEQVEDAFYKTYQNKEVNSYGQKIVYEDESGMPSYAVTIDDNRQYSIQFFAAEGVRAGLSNSDRHIRTAVENGIVQLEDRAQHLVSFLRMNKDVQNEHVRDICEIAEDALKEIRKILPENASSLRVAFFDWDGTVVDTAQAGESAFADFYMQLFKVPREEALRVWQSLDGKTLHDQYAVICRTAEEKGIPLTMTEKEYTDSFIATKMENIERAGGIVSLIVPSAVEFMRHLKSMGVKVHIASGFRLRELRGQISALGLHDMVDGAYGSPTNDAEKVDLPESKVLYIKSVLKAYGFTSKEAFMVGDTMHDVQSGHKAGVLVIGRGRDVEKSTALISAGAAFAVQDFSNPNRIVRMIEEKITSSRQSSTGLFEIVEDFTNNRRSKFVKEANRLIDISGKHSALKDRVGKQKLKNEDPTAQIEDRVKKIAALIDVMDKQGISADVLSITEFLKSNVDQLESDALIAAIIMHARQAKKDNQKFILGLETDWVPGIKEIGYGTQHDAINSLMQHIDELHDALRSIGLDNVEIIHKSSEELADALLEKAQKTQTKFSNIVILASDKTIKLPNFKPLMDADDKDRPFIAVIDPKYLEEWYKNNKNSLQQLDINIIKLLYITLELAAGKEKPEIPLIFDYDNKRRVVILLPRAEPKDYQRELLDIYRGREKALQAA